MFQDGLAAECVRRCDQRTRLEVRPEISHSPPAALFSQSSTRETVLTRLSEPRLPPCDPKPPEAIPCPLSFRLFFAAISMPNVLVLIDQDRSSGRALREALKSFDDETDKLFLLNVFRYVITAKTRS